MRSKDEPLNSLKVTVKQSEEDWLKIFRNCAAIALLFRNCAAMAGSYTLVLKILFLDLLKLKLMLILLRDRNRCLISWNLPKQFSKTANWNVSPIAVKISWKLVTKVNVQNHYLVHVMCFYFIMYKNTIVWSAVAYMLNGFRDIRHGYVTIISLWLLLLLSNRSKTAQFGPFI